MIEQLQGLTTTFEEKQSDYYAVISRKSETESNLDGFTNNLEAIKEKFLMRFDKKELDQITQKVEDNYRKMFEPQVKQKQVVQVANLKGILSESVIE